MLGDGSWSVELRRDGERFAVAPAVVPGFTRADAAAGASLEVVRDRALDGALASLGVAREGVWELVDSGALGCVVVASDAGQVDDGPDVGSGGAGPRARVQHYAATYAVRGEAGAFGVDVIAQDVETDDQGREVARVAAGWSWHPAPDADTWDTGAADRHLYALGWLRVSGWLAQDDLGGVPGWVCDVQRDCERRGVVEVLEAPWCDLCRAGEDVRSAMSLDDDGVVLVDHEHRVGQVGEVEVLIHREDRCRPGATWEAGPPRVQLGVCDDLGSLTVDGDEPERLAGLILAAAEQARGLR